MKIQSLFDNQVRYAVSDKSDGNLSYLFGDAQSVLDNRTRFVTACGLAIDSTVCPQLEHATTIIEVTESDKGRGMRSMDDAPLADALVTRGKGLGLFLLTADCIPLVLYDPNLPLLGLAHVSWKNAHADFVQKLVDYFKDQGSTTDQILLQIGPAIAKQSYKILNPIQQDDDRWTPFVNKAKDGQTHIDLSGMIISAALKAGVLPVNISQSLIDTATAMDYFSHYRSTRTSEPEGRFATLIYMI